MRINTDATERDIDPALDWIGGLIGTWLDKRMAGFEQHQRRNPLLAMYYEENFELEFALAKARRYRKATGRFPKGPEFDPLYSFLIPAHRIHAILPVSARKAFEGRLRDSSAYGLRPFGYEVGIATHLMQRQWDIEFADLDGPAGIPCFDFLITRGRVELEIECKTSSADAGRKIHRQAMNRLADFIVPITQELADGHGCHVICVRVADRLGAHDQELKAIAASVADAVSKGTAVEQDGARVTYRRADITEWPDPHNDPQAHEFFRKLVGSDNSHLMIYGRGKAAVIAVSVESATPDQVVEAIATQAKDGAKQCSGNRPALVSVNLADPLDREELSTFLNTSNGLHRVAHEVFKDGKRDHVDSIIYTVPQSVRQLQGARQMSAPAIALYNPAPKFVCPEARQVFCAT